MASIQVTSADDGSLLELTQAALLDAFSDVPALDLFITNSLRKPLNHIVGGTAPMPYLCLQVTQALISTGSLPALVRALYALRQNVASVCKLFDQMFPAEADPTRTRAMQWIEHLPCCVRQSSVVIDREKLQRTIDHAETRAGKNVIIVNGEKRSGKTYSKRVISALAPRYCYRLVSINLQNELGSGGTPDVIVRALVNQMDLGAHGIPEQGQSWELVALHFGGGTSANNGVPIGAILDHLVAHHQRDLLSNQGGAP